MTNKTETGNEDYARNLSKRFHNAGQVFEAASKFYKNGKMDSSLEGSLLHWVDGAMPIYGESIALIESTPHNKYRDLGGKIPGDVVSVGNTYAGALGKNLALLPIDKILYFDFISRRFGRKGLPFSVNDVRDSKTFEGLAQICFLAEDIITRLRDC